jgi:hypothetical protein
MMNLLVVTQLYIAIVRRTELSAFYSLDERSRPNLQKILAILSIFLCCAVSLGFPTPSAEGSGHDLSPTATSSSA